VTWITAATTFQETMCAMFASVEPDDKKHRSFSGRCFAHSGKSGFNSRAGVLSHEMSHFADIGNTDDAEIKNGVTAYGTGLAGQLARKSPAGALNNADNFEFFLEAK